MKETGDYVRQVIDFFPCTTGFFSMILRIKDSLQDGAMHQNLNELINIHRPDIVGNPKAIRHLQRDAWHSFMRYHIPFDEFFLYHFTRLTPEARREYVGEYEKDMVSQMVNDPAEVDTLIDKWLAYQAYRPFYGREMLLVNTDTSYEDFFTFVQRHPRFLAKNPTGSGGREIQLYDFTDGTLDEEQVFLEIQKNGNVIEELILQAESLAAFHPQSINSVRCATAWKDGSPVILFSFFRMGRGNSYIDNACSGGLFAGVDVDTGLVFTRGFSKTYDMDASFLRHPDSGLVIPGFQIPRWEELKAVCLRLAAVNPKIVYTSWDMALTDAGWVMIEGNTRGMLSSVQALSGHGIRSYLAQYFPQLQR